MEYASKVRDIPDLLVAVGECEDGLYVVLFAWIEIEIEEIASVTGLMALAVGANPRSTETRISLN